MTDDLLVQAIDAVRAAGEADATHVAAATRARLRRSLEAHAKHRRKVSIVTIIALMFGGTMAWAVTSGRLPILSSRSEPEPEESLRVPMQLDEPARRRAPVASAVVEPSRTELPAPIAPVSPIAQPPAPKKVIAKPRPVEVLYRKAHELHFRGADYTAALAAWDAYLAAEPTGRFAVEARFNRALVLIRLSRYAEAHSALAPFASGEVEPAGYRREEAQRLVDRLARVNER